jgi:hypothetical protein
VTQANIGNDLARVEEFRAGERPTCWRNGIQPAGLESDELEGWRIANATCRRAAEVDVAEPAGQVQHVVKHTQAPLKAHKVQSQPRSIAAECVEELVSLAIEPLARRGKRGHGIPVCPPQV